ncbi:MAG: pyruvate formate lyase family protein [Clostridiales bacterium]|jgi:formate C-acetyltransferase|nr:pyruvate formate lyase family protein [Clostridiales bacterium]MDR2751307.1 pyruvate formate lyase family protein [Clostridiales bacterium]
MGQLSYSERIEILKKRKIEQTQEKVCKEGGLDEDDYGRVVPPDGFSWSVIPNHANGSFYGLEGWSANFSSLLESHPIYVDPLDAFAGRWMFFLSRMKGPIWNPDFNYDHLRADFARYNILPGIGGDAHFATDYKMGLELGWNGLIEKIGKYKDLNGEVKRPFYEAEEKTVRAIQTWIKRTSGRIQELMDFYKNLSNCEDLTNIKDSQDPKDILENLENMKKANDWVSENPPRTMREVCQWICWYNMAKRTYNRDGAGCQLDEILRPYYERDVEAGILDDDEARFLIACLLLNDTHYYQLAGPGEDGKDMGSHISFLILEAAEMLNSSCNITIRVHDGIDQGFFLKSVKCLLSNKNGFPRYSGDKALVEGFMRCGFSAELARQRIAVGCNWMSLPGLEYTLNDLVKVNMAKVFEVSFAQMMTEPSKSVKRLWEIFKIHSRKAVEAAGRGIDFHLSFQELNEPELVLNLLSHGPIEKGLDASAGGAKHMNLAIDGAGIAVVADSFSALEQRIEKEALTDWEEVWNAVSSNFQKSEWLRLMLSKSSRYGNDDGGAGNDWGVRISKLFTEEVRRLNTIYPPRNFIPGWFSWANTIEFGKATGATPNGRKSGEPINHGANPLPRFRTDGAVTALANTIASIQPGYGNTAPIQLELDPGIAITEEDVQSLAAMIKTFFELGATLLNINIIDKGKVLAAHSNPDLYPDLVVRVTGFTAYFSMLSQEFRQLVVDRIIASR